MSTTQQPEALRLADKYEAQGFLGDHRFAKDHWCTQAAAELRRQHARIADLEAQLSAIGAGGVEPMRKRAAAQQAVQAAVPVNLDFGTLREIVNGLHRAWGDAQGYAYCPGSEPYREARQRAMSMHAGALRYIESMESYAAPAHPAEGVPAQAAASTDQSRAQFDAWIRTHEEEHGAVDEASAWAAWSACSLMQAKQGGAA